MSLRYSDRTRTLGGALASRVAQWSQRSIVKSIQRGTISITGATSNTATLTAVDVNNCELRYVGRTNAAGQAANQALVQLVLTNSTTITASVNTSPGGTTTAVSYEVIEYYPGYLKSIQRFQTSAAATTQAIAAVNVSKTTVDYLGCTDTDATTVFTRDADLTLTNATTVTIAYGGASAQTVSLQVVERY